MVLMEQVERGILSHVEKGLKEEVYLVEPRLQDFRKVDLVLALGRKMDLSWGERERLVRLLLFHDVGKIVLPSLLLRKPKVELEPSQWRLILSHAEVGYRVASQLAGLMGIAEEILSWRERWNGGGDPRRLRKRQIPLLSRMGILINAYEAMILERPYKPPRVPLETMAEIHGNLGTQFDPEMGCFLSRFWKKRW